MARWFAGMIKYNSEFSLYENTGNNGVVYSKEVNFYNPYIIDQSHPKYDIDNGIDSFQIYAQEIIDNNGVDNYKKTLLSKRYDSIILKGNNTNYYS